MLRAVAVALAVCLLAGCGGGDGRLSAEELATRANEICNEFDREIEALPTATSVSEIVEYADRAGPIFDRSLAALKKLDPPKNLETDFDRWITFGDRAAETVELLRNAAANADVGEIQAIAERAEREDADADALARKLGFDDCAD